MEIYLVNVKLVNINKEKLNTVVLSSNGERKPSVEARQRHLVGLKLIAAVQVCPV